MDTKPRPGDSDNTLLRKIASSLDGLVLARGIAVCGDEDTSVFVPIADLPELSIILTGYAGSGALVTGGYWANVDGQPGIVLSAFEIASGAPYPGGSIYYVVYKP